MSRVEEILIDHDASKAPQYIESGHNIVAIDVLRATSTIVVALFQGAAVVYPCAEVEQARTLKKQRNVLLVGERKGEIIDGFDYTNSPYDLSGVDLLGKEIAITTSDGTKLISESIEANKVLIGSTLNYEFVSQAILAFGGKWVMLGAGSSGDFRPEDQVGCALIANEVLRDSSNVKANRYTQELVDMHVNNWEKSILESLSTQKLAKIDRMIDVHFVIEQANKYPILPVAYYSLGQIYIQNYTGNINEKTTSGE